MTPKEQKLIDSLFKKIQEEKDNIAYATERLNKYKESIAVASCPFQVGNFITTDTGACSKHGAQVKAIVPSRFFSPESRWELECAVVTTDGMVSNCIEGVPEGYVVKLRVR